MNQFAPRSALRVERKRERGGGGERERETDRQTDRQTERDREIERETKGGRKRENQRALSMVNLNAGCFIFLIEINQERVCKSTL